MDSKKYWFFGSKLNTVLLLILIILMIIALRWMYKDKEALESIQVRDQINEKYQYNDTNQNGRNWIASPSEFGNIVFYPPDWQIMPNYYGSAAAQARGEQYLVGYDFTLPSGAVVTWGGPQSSCIDNNEFGEFKYGVSNLTCLKNLRTSIGEASARKILAPSDLRLFGDFVLKNQ